MDDAVIVHLLLDDVDFGSAHKRESLYHLQDQLAAAIEEAGAGEFDGDEFGEGECVLYMYGADADALFAAVEPILKASPHATGGFAIKRYGEASAPKVREVKVDL